MTTQAPTEAERQEAAVAKANEYREQVAKGSYDDREPDHVEAPAEETPTETVDPDAPVKPDHVPDKFWNAETGEVNFEAWTKAHTALETKFHQPDAPDKDEAAPAEDAPVDADETPKDEPAQPTAISEAQNEYAQNGKLSPEMYQKLAANGLDESTVNAYIAGQESAAAMLDQKAFAVTEGEENFGAMVKWASEHATEAELKLYNMGVTSGDPEIHVQAISTMFERFKANGTYEGQRVSGDAAPSASNRFNSKEEYDAAMREPSSDTPHKTRYEVDAAYRTAVSKKMAASRKAGIDLFNNSTARG